MKFKPLILFIAFLLPGVVLAQTTEVWVCNTAGVMSSTVGGSAQVPANTEIVPVEPINTDTSGNGLCTLASTVSAADYTRAATCTNSTTCGAFAWVTLASLGLGSGTAPPPVTVPQGVAVISWTAPTTGTSSAGGSIPLTGANAITGYDVYEGSTLPVTTSSTLLTPTPLAATATSFTTTALSPGTYYFGVNALIGASAGLIGASPQLIVPTITVTVVPAAPGTVTVTYSSSTASAAATGLKHKAADVKKAMK
jgi:hypothetical protein